MCKLYQTQVMNCHCERNVVERKRKAQNPLRAACPFGTQQSQDMGLLHYAVASYALRARYANAMTNIFLQNWDAPTPEEEQF